MAFIINTPSHYILNLAFLGKTIAPNANVAIVFFWVAAIEFCQSHCDRD
ncbi:MAG: hypothetical protein IGR93_21780 [Hydrococcus sp. C42_A2020_068]|nr:hypothetical protein [Pleurocapsa sp. PCC 7327]AFY79334.1 hypothetical protein Ple7327_4205 [Pleurocapsa sp. PCC 7327]MBF2022645.1 hypothetical protein [Hydrococcus sp. C42_A2020_068]